jgi:hypothetical protein
MFGGFRLDAQDIQVSPVTEKSVQEDIGNETLEKYNKIIANPVV